MRFDQACSATKGVAQRNAARVITECDHRLEFTRSSRQESARVSAFGIVVRGLAFGFHVFFQKSSRV